MPNSGRPGRGEQGALDVLMLVADSSALVATVKLLPEFLRARKKAMSVTITVKGRQITVTAEDNAEEVIRVVKEFLDR